MFRGLHTTALLKHHHHRALLLPEAVLASIDAVSIMADSFPTSPGSSQFTRRHLELLGESSPESPLRVIALVDYDAFYAQCETVRLGLPPTEPLAVRQWNAVIAINYPARAYGLKRGMSVEEVTRLCPSLTLQHIATWREGDPTWAYRPDVIDNLTTDKAALDPYRLESRKTLKLVKDLLPTHPPQRIEKASVDEFFIDLSGQVHNFLLERFPELSGLQTEPDERLPLPESSLPLLWPPDELTTGMNSSQDETIDWDDISLNIGVEIVRDIRHRLSKDLGYTCSAGIGRIWLQEAQPTNGRQREGYSPLSGFLQGDQDSSPGWKAGR